MSSALSEIEFRKHITLDKQEFIQELIVLQEVDSTNTYLLEQAAPKLSQAKICIAEHQSAGKGRQGKSWQDNFGGSLLYSFAWSYEKVPNDVSALTLAVGVVVQRTLQGLGYQGIQLKWPNDLLVNDAKLGGILVESKLQGSGIQLVCGIGINVLSGIDDSQIEQQVTSLQEIDVQQSQNNIKHSRNRIAAELSAGLIDLMNAYTDTGFSKWQSEWQALDVFQGAKIKVIEGEKEFIGISNGIDDSGAFLLQTDNGRVNSFTSANVSIRKI